MIFRRSALIGVYILAAVAQRFRFLKDPAFVDAVFLQKSKRTRALGYVMRMALLLFRGLERRGRQAATPFPTAYRGVVARPTGPLILRHGRGIQVLGRDRDRHYLAVPAAHRPAVAVTLAALGFPATIFTQCPPRAAPLKNSD